MQYNLMAKEDLKNYGFDSVDNEKVTDNLQTLAKLDSYVQHHQQSKPTDVTRVKQKIDYELKEQHLEHIKR